MRPGAVAIRGKPVPPFAAIAPSNRPWIGLVLSYLLGAVAFASYALAVGQDANWDLQNYHDYDAFALLHGRYPLDVAPGGPQTYLNPLPYLLPYLLRHHLPPLAAAAALAAAQALVVPLAWALSGCVVAGRGKQALAVRALATLTAATGAITVSEIGTSFADLQLAALGLAALLAALHAGTEDGRRADQLHLLAGILSGAETGLKLTNAVVVIGILGAVIVPWTRSAGSLKAAGLVVLGAAGGALLSNGWWGFYLWHNFGSPTFPFLNTVFRSRSALLSSFGDARFLPHDALDALAYPFEIAAGLHPTAEIPFQDWHFALALPLCAVFALTRGRSAVMLDRAVSQASAFLWTGFVAWLLSISIQRYAIVFEIVSGLLVVAIIAAALPRRASLPVCLLAAAATIAWTRPGDWWHRPWSDAYVPRPPAEVADAPAAFLLTAPPLGYWVRALPRQSRSYLLEPMLLQPGGRLTQRFEAGLDHPPGGRIWAVGLDRPIAPHLRDTLAAHGFVLSPPCYRARSLWWVDTVFCRAEHVGSRPSAASDLRVGDSVAFSDQGSGWIYEVSGWQPADGGSTWAEGPTSALVLKPEAGAQPLALDFQVKGVVGPSWPQSEVDIAVPNAPTSRWTFRQGESWTVHTVCVPEAARLDAGVLTVAFQSPRPHTPQDAGVGTDTRSLSFALRTMTLRPARAGECEG